ncbi:hypothetical protein [Leptospira perdikensis]|uniref:Uncharacterized protein n=1 Tax=Leptospira perdikensis TaxID=2484948 RepID=A0A4R9JGR6_9LEPT|nr:hypothetical protein [Leptospira perdikensis]TGL40332.1 hypothetical protein EHQ49_09745 [Leptospira perdikensis]
MIKNSFSILLGLVSAMAIMMAVEFLNSFFVKPPSDEIIANPELLKEFMTNLPTSAYLPVYFGYVLGAFVAGIVTMKLSKSNQTLMIVLVGSLLTLAGAFNFFVFLPGQPLWFVILSLLSFLPFVWLGKKMVSKS